MKTIKYIVAATLIGTALFTGCTKADSPTSPIAANEVINNGPTAAITYRLQVILPPVAVGALVKWNSGSITANELLFDGTHVYGNMLQRYEYFTNEVKAVNLFGTSFLGVVNVPMNFYNSSSLKIQLNPYDGMNAFTLNGVCNTTNGTPVITLKPIEFVVNGPVALQSGWSNGLTIASPAYLATLSMDMSQLINGISPAMVASATETGGTILISSSSNTGMYNIMVGNLQNNLLQAEFAPQQATTGNTVNPATE